jgi:hypothetical protein
MKPIPTKLHGVLDYATAGLLIFAPAIFTFENEGAPARIPQMLGASILFYSLLTRYELGLVKKIPMKTHLTLDFLGALFLGLSPWLFGFANVSWKPHVLVAAFEIVTVLMSRSLPGEAFQRHYDVRRTPAH